MTEVLQQQGKHQNDTQNSETDLFMSIGTGLWQRRVFKEAGSKEVKWLVSWGFIHTVCIIVTSLCYGQKQPNWNMSCSNQETEVCYLGLSIFCYISLLFQFPQKTFAGQEDTTIEKELAVGGEARTGASSLKRLKPWNIYECRNVYRYSCSFI